MIIASRVFHALALTSALIATTAAGMTVIPPDFRKLVSEADNVVDGTVVSIRTGIENRGGRPMVYTYVTVEVAETVKGKASRAVELRMLGGTAGDLTVHVPGMPRFEVGTRGMFFIVGNGSQFCPLVGIGHGHYPVVERSSDGTAVVLRHNLETIGDVAQVADPLDHGTAALRAGAASDLSRSMTLSEFKRQIREEAANARAH